MTLTNWAYGEFLNAPAGLVIVILCLVILGEDFLGYVTNKLVETKKKITIKV